MLYAESPKLCLQRKLDKRSNRVADESGHEFYANRFGFYTTSVGLLFCFPTLTIIEYKIFYFLFFGLFDILINSQADIKTHETRCLWLMEDEKYHYLMRLLGRPCIFFYSVLVFTVGYNCNTSRALSFAAKLRPLHQGMPLSSVHCFTCLKTTLKCDKRDSRPQSR